MTGWPRTFRAPLRAPGDRVPVTLVTGFLGSGKTTLVNHILANRHGVRAAVLVNELGAIAVDNDLIIASGDEMIAFDNGCICCSVNGDLVDGIVRVLSHPDPVDHILVETTGVADPLPVARTFLRTEFRDAVRLDAIVALADAEHFSLDLFDGIAARNQIRYADIILISKTECVDSKRRSAVEAGIRRLNQKATILHATRGAVPLPLILDVDLFRGGMVCEEAPEVHNHLSPDGFVSLSFESSRPFSVTRFQAFLDVGRPSGLFRGKGFLWLAETGRRYVFHMVGSRCSLEEDDRPDRGPNRLVLIGRDMDITELRSRISDCLVDENCVGSQPA